MNKEQLTEKLNKRFTEELSYEPKFEIIRQIDDSCPFKDYQVVWIKWKNNRIEYNEIKVIADYTGDNPWIERIGDQLEIIFTIDKAQD